MRVAIVSRGYGGRARGVTRVTVHSRASEVGDEPLLLARRAAGDGLHRTRPRRGRARPRSRDGADIVICDDGLQHLALVRECEIVVIDGQRGFGNGSLLPRGPLRESPRRLRRVNAVVVNGAITAPDFQLPRFVTGTHFVMHMRPGDARPVAGGGALRSLSSFRGAGVHAVAAIGNPQRFFDMLRDAGLTVYEHPMPDHHAFKSGDLNFGDSLPVLMTEKDAVKCAAFADERCWYVPVTAEFAEGEARRTHRPGARARQGIQDRPVNRKRLMDDRLLDILACPVCKGPLKFQRAARRAGVPRGPPGISDPRRRADDARRRRAPARARRSAAGALMTFRVVIPARFDSSRLPGKALLPLAGKPMLQWVHERARGSRAAEVIIATDDERIASAARGFGAEVAMTAAHACLRHGSHRRSGRGARLGRRRHRGERAGRRAADSARGHRPGGAAAGRASAARDIATLAAKIEQIDDFDDPNTVKVACDATGRALYFSRAPIPWNRDAADHADAGQPAAHRHLCLSRGARCGAWRSLPPGRLEQIEKLEQLRALENGMEIRVALAVERPLADVNTAADLERAERALNVRP